MTHHGSLARPGHADKDGRVANMLLVPYNVDQPVKDLGLFRFEGKGVGNGRTSTFQRHLGQAPSSLGEFASAFQRGTVVVAAAGFVIVIAVETAIAACFVVFFYPFLRNAIPKTRVYCEKGNIFHSLDMYGYPP